MKIDKIEIVAPDGQALEIIKRVMAQEEIILKHNSQILEMIKPMYKIETKMRDELND